MAYGTDEDTCIDPKTGVFRNLLDITDKGKLEEAEASFSAVAITSLKEQPIAGNFDLEHLRALHAHLFGAVYAWAGELRTVELAKGSTRFANVEFLYKAAHELFTALRTESLLRDLPDEQYYIRLAHYYSEINVLHPFREGNGRTQRAFITLLVAESGRRVAWENMDADANLAASIAAYNGDENQLVALLASLIS